MKSLIIILSTFLIFSGCSTKVKDSESYKTSGQELTRLVEEALWGSAAANTRLSMLVNSTTPSPDNYNQFAVDSAISMTGAKLYSVLVEYPNPIHNILAVYDDSLNLKLQDNSLNGNITSKWEILSGKLYLVASEKFVSKDILKLSRLSLYSTTDEKVDLVFRTFTRLEKEGKIYQQYIENTSSIAILTRLTSNSNFRFNNTSDTFKFKTIGNEYSSSDDIFTTFILSEIKNADWPVEKPELILENLDKEITGTTDINKSADNLNGNGFQLSLNSDWGKPIRISVTNHLIMNLEGTRYINEKLGSQITAIELPPGSNSSQFIKYNFGKVSSKNYLVKTTDLIKSGRNFIQFFEHSCPNKTFILLLQAPKYTYEKNKDVYNEITSSFAIDC